MVGSQRMEVRRPVVAGGHNLAVERVIGTSKALVTEAKGLEGTPRSRSRAPSASRVPPTNAVLRVTARHDDIPDLGLYTFGSQIGVAAFLVLRLTRHHF